MVEIIFLHSILVWSHHQFLSLYPLFFQGIKATLYASRFISFRNVRQRDRFSKSPIPSLFCQQDLDEVMGAYFVKSGGVDVRMLMRPPQSPGDPVNVSPV